MLDAQSGTTLDLDCFAQSAVLLGPLFHIRGSGAASNSIFGAFGDAFHEYCASVFRRIFPSSSVLASRAFCSLLDTNGQEIADAGLVFSYRDFVCYHEVVLGDSRARDYIYRKEWQTGTLPNPKDPRGFAFAKGDA